MNKPAYDAGFFNLIADNSAQSAAVVVPLLLERFPNIKSVVDVGCGVGTWLAAFRQLGVDRIHGLDGYPPPEALRIPPETFQRVDLQQSIRVVDRFDLAISLEVAEHLTPARASGFVADLCALSDRVVFSAALPLQGGVNHLNEQWPSYWIELFAKQGYGCEDSLRARIWEDRRVEGWYRQNILYFVKGLSISVPPGVNRVHPEVWAARMAESPIRKIIKSLTPVPLREAYRAFRFHAKP